LESQKQSARKAEQTDPVHHNSQEGRDICQEQGGVDKETE